MYKSVKNAQIHIRVKAEEKEEVQRILMQCGTNINAVIDMLFRYIINYRGIPFDVRIPEVDNAVSGNVLNSGSFDQAEPKTEPKTESMGMDASIVTSEASTTAMEREKEDIEISREYQEDVLEDAEEGEEPLEEYESLEEWEPEISTVPVAEWSVPETEAFMEKETSEEVFLLDPLEIEERRETQEEKEEEETQRLLTAAIEFMEEPLEDPGFLDSLEITEESLDSFSMESMGNAWGMDLFQEEEDPQNSYQEIMEPLENSLQKDVLRTALRIEHGDNEMAEVQSSMPTLIFSDLFSDGQPAEDLTEDFIEEESIGEGKDFVQQSAAIKEEKEAERSLQQEMRMLDLFLEKL